jgi:hypothetical protein
LALLVVFALCAIGVALVSCAPPPQPAYVVAQPQGQYANGAPVYAAPPPGYQPIYAPPPSHDGFLSGLIVGHLLGGGFGGGTTHVYHTTTVVRPRYYGSPYSYRSTFRRRR